MTLKALTSQILHQSMQQRFHAFVMLFSHIYSYCLNI